MEELQEQITHALSPTHPITPQTIKASITHPISIKDLQPVLTAMVDTGLIDRHEKRYTLHE